MSPNEHRFESRLIWTGAAKGPTVDYATYSRECRVEFPGKPAIMLSSAAVFRGDPVLHDPEDLLVAALSTCHFLSYVALCARRGVHVTAYEDEAVGVMSRPPEAKTFRFTDVLLKPRVTIASDSDAELARALHEKAHEECFIAASVNFPVRHEATILLATAV